MNRPDPNLKPPAKPVPETPTEKKFPTNPRRKDFDTEDHESRHLQFHRPEPAHDEPFRPTNPPETPIHKLNDSRNMTPLHKAHEPRNFGRNTDCDKPTPIHDNPEMFDQ